MYKHGLRSVGGTHQHEEKACARWGRQLAREELHQRVNRRLVILHEAPRARRVLEGLELHHLDVAVGARHRHALEVQPAPRERVLLQQQPACVELGRVELGRHHVDEHALGALGDVVADGVAVPRQRLGLRLGPVEALEVATEVDLLHRRGALEVDRKSVV